MQPRPIWGQEEELSPEAFGGLHINNIFRALDFNIRRWRLGSMGLEGHTLKRVS